MIQDAHPVRSGLPDGYLAHFKIGFVTGPTYTLDTSRLPSGFSISIAATGRLNVVFPSCTGVRWMGGGVDAKAATVASQRKVNPISINPNAGTMQVQFLDNTATPLEADPVTTSDIYFTLALETL